MEDSLQNLAERLSKKSPTATEILIPEVLDQREGVLFDSAIPSWDSLPKSLQEKVKELAAAILDPIRGQTIVTGSTSSGKGFLIRQLAASEERFSDLIEGGFPKFFVFDPTLIQISANNCKQLVKSLARDGINFVFVTRHPNAAQFLNKAGARVILEMDAHLLMMPQVQVSELSNWPVVTVDDVQLTLEELVSLLVETVLVDLENAYSKKFTRRDIKNFVNDLERAHYIYDEPDEDEGERRLIHPPGCWAQAFRAYASLAALDEAEINRAGPRRDLIDRHFDAITEPLDLDEGAFVMGMTSGDGETTSIYTIANEAAGRDPKAKTSKSRQGSKGNPNAFRDNSDLLKKMKEDVIGQDSAVEEIVEAMQIPSAGLNTPTKPLRTMILLGPTGVGKTQTALSLAKNLYKEEAPVIRLDMSEYSEEHQVSKILGAPPGYVGYDDGNPLGEKLAENPHSIVLLDEAEKAHPKIWDAFLQVFDAGVLTDSYGQEIDFTKSVVIMTSNLGADSLSKGSLGFTVDTGGGLSDSKKSLIDRATREFFRPEFINRIDHKIIFDQISQNSIKKILMKEFTVLKDRADNAGFALKSPGSDILTELVKQSDTGKYGAREIQRTVERLVSVPLARAMLNNRKASKLKLKLDNDKINVIAEDNGGKS